MDFSRVPSVPSRGATVGRLSIQGGSWRVQMLQVRLLSWVFLGALAGCADKAAEGDPAGSAEPTKPEGSTPGDCADLSDNDGDGRVDCEDDGCTDAAECTPTDADGDGFFSVASGGDDCDDTSVAVYPGADEVCDGLDNDCNGILDDDPVDGVVGYVDADADGFGDPDETRTGCTLPEGTVADATDCDDGAVGTYPGADEYCDEEDNDCDEEVDEDAVDRSTFYADADTDGFGDPDVPILACAQPAGTVTDATDCDDADPDTYPGADEPFLAGDSNCDLVVEDELELPDADSLITGAAGDLAGYRWAGDGDVDGDGLSDVLLAAYHQNDRAGAVYLFLGSTLAGGGDLEADDADAVFVGAVAQDEVGFSVAFAGDLDSDGYDDVVIGADRVDGAASDQGAVYVFSGSSISAGTSYGMDEASVVIEGDSPTEFLGYDVARVGDLDGDLVPDLAVSATYGDTSGSRAGDVYIFLAANLPSSGTLTVADADHIIAAETLGDRCCRMAAQAGDLDGDGLADLMLGAWGYNGQEGAAFIVFGASLADETTMMLSSADLILTGESRYDYAGFTIESAGDVDGDGVSDLLVGAYYNSDVSRYAGKAYLWLGSSLLSAATGPGATVSLADGELAFRGEGEFNYAGVGLVGLGDLDGDGLGEVAIGASGWGSYNAGRMYLFRGSSLLTTGVLDLADADFVLTGEDRDAAGYWLGRVGDIDGDGRDEVAVSAPSSSEGGASSGGLYLFQQSL